MEIDYGDGEVGSGEREARGLESSLTVSSQSDLTHLWQPIETAPRNNTPFDVRVVAPSGEELVIPDCRYVRMFSKWEIWGKENRLSPYLTPTHWSPRAPAEAPS